MFIYPTYFKRLRTQINQFSYISTEFLHLYIYVLPRIHNKQLLSPRIFYLYIHIYLHMSTYFLIHMYILIYLFVFSSLFIVDRPSRSQCVLNRLPHAAHTTIPWITFCNTIMRFNQSKKFDIFISNVFDTVAYNWNIQNCSIDTNNCIQLL